MQAMPPRHADVVGSEALAARAGGWQARFGLHGSSYAPWNVARSRPAGATSPVAR